MILVLYNDNFSENAINTLAFVILIMIDTGKQRI